MFSRHGTLLLQRYLMIPSSARCRKEFHSDYKMQIVSTEPDLTYEFMFLFNTINIFSFVHK